MNFNPYNGSGDAQPSGGVIMDAAGDLFGTTDGSGITDGTVFELVKNGSGSYTLRNLINFNGADGSAPEGGLVADTAGDLFGTTDEGGAYGYGTVFEIAKTAGGYASTVTTLLSFNGPSDIGGTYSMAGLIIDAVGDLFGTTFEGGLFGDGTAFELKNNFNGSYSERILANFDGANGAYPEAGLIADSAGDLFGTTFSGGGTVFEITDSGYQVSAPAPPVVTLASSPAASNVATATLGTAAPANGTDALSVALTSDPDFATGSTLTLSNGTLIYTPGLITAGLVGTDTISYAVTDTVTGEVTTETQAVTLSNGPAPLVTLAASPSASNGTTATLGTAAPANGTDALSVALTSDADFAAGSTLTLSNGTLIYTPGLITAGLVGTDTISYAVTDTVTGGVTTETQAVTLSNGPAPLVTLAASPSASNVATATLGTAAPANGTDALSVALTSDADFATGSTITLSNGALIYTPGLVIADLAGTDTISYAVTDTVTGGVTTETQTVTLSNGPAPLVTLAASPSASNGTTATLGTAAPGYGTDPLTVALTSDADFTTGSTLVLTNGALVYTPGLITAKLAGPDTFTYTVTDTVTSAVTSETQTVTLSAGRAIVVSSGHTSSGITVLSGGSETVLSGGTAISTTVNSGGAASIYGSASSTIVNTGGVERVYAGGATVGTMLSGGTEIVSSGGSVTSTTVSSSGKEYVSSGGGASNTVVSSGGSTYVYGAAISTTVSTGGVQRAYAGGATTGTVVLGGGIEIVSSGGIASSTVVNSGGSSTSRPAAPPAARSSAAAAASLSTPPRSAPR